MILRIRQQRTQAFTLIEMIIGAALMSLVLTGSYLCLNAALASQKAIEPRADVIQTARVVLALMAADIRSACPLPKGAAFLGVGRTLGDIQADNLDFATHHFSPVNDGDGDFCESSYFVQRNPKTGRFSLWRRRNPIFALDPLSGGMQEELATGVRGLAFQYYDGLDWYDNWGDADGKGRTGGAGKKQNSLKVRSNLEGLPAAVKITLSLDSNPKKSRPDEAPSAIQSLEPPMVFQTVARIEVASDSSSGASPGQSNGGARSDSPGRGGGF